MYKYIILNSMLLLCILIFQSLSQAVLLDKVVAKVNDDVVLWTELVTAMKQQNLSPSSPDIRAKEKEVLNSIIDRKLQTQEARRLGYRVSNAEIERTINDIKEKYNLSLEDFEESLRTEGLTFDDYKSELREKLLLTKVVNGEIHSKLVITDSDVQNYYDENQIKYELSSRVHIRQIFLADPLDLQMRDEIKDKAERIYQRIQDGEDIGDLAKEFSEDSTRNAGGDIGFVQRDYLLPEVADVAFSLDEGQVSEPFWSTKGVHIIKVEEKEIATGTKGSNEELEKILRNDLYQKHYNKWIRRLRKNAFIEINL